MTMTETLVSTPAEPAELGQTVEYHTGFGNGFESEALPGALPVGRNSPQRCAYGLYAEQLSGSPFTAPRASNERSWLYRIRPTVANWGRFAKADSGLWRTAPCVEVEVPPAPLRWDPVPLPAEGVSLIEGIRTITTAGDAASQAGMAAHVYLATRSMENEYFYNADAEMLFVPQQGGLRLRTEFGVIDIDPGEVAVIPRGVKFLAELRGGPARGYLCENYGGALTLPERGPIGANCLANPRDFKTPAAAFEDKETPCRVHVKWCGKFYVTEIGHSPLDVVAWHGNYAPFKYDLRTFSPVGAILFDHPDPSIFTVLTAPSGEEGTANVDFVIFPPRWQVAENSFRPPWFHRNVMSELMGLVHGVYDAKAEGFLPGGVSIHNSFSAHGPDLATWDKATRAELKPQKVADTLAFMWESCHVFRPTKFAMQAKELQKDYDKVWDGFK
jgi:homogentisate 1,2-dioxygenase